MSRHLRTTLVVACGITVLAGCSKSEKSIADTTSTPISPATGAAASLALADVAGTWKMRSVPTSGGDTTTHEYTMTATGEAGGWKLTFPNGLVVLPRVTAAGDSIVIDAGAYKSVRRKGVDVTTHATLRKFGDKLMGTSVAHYKTEQADSVVSLRLEGTRMP